MPTIWSRDRMRLATPGRLYASTTALKQFAAPNWRQSLTYWGWHVLSRTHRSDPCYDQLGAESLRPFRNFVDWPRLLWGCVHNMCGIFVIIEQQQDIFTAWHRTHCFWHTNSKDSSCSYFYAGNWDDCELMNERDMMTAQRDAAVCSLHGQGHRTVSFDIFALKMFAGKSNVMVDYMEKATSKLFTESLYEIIWVGCAQSGFYVPVTYHSLSVMLGNCRHNYVHISKWICTYVRRTYARTA